MLRVCDIIGRAGYREARCLQKRGFALPFGFDRDLMQVCDRLPVRQHGEFVPHYVYGRPAGHRQGSSSRTSCRVRRAVANHDYADAHRRTAPLTQTQTKRLLTERQRGGACYCTAMCTALPDRPLHGFKRQSARTHLGKFQSRGLPRPLGTFPPASWKHHPYGPALH